MTSGPEEVLVFDLRGDYAHFRKVYTTASQLTYGVPPRTTLTGLIAGILGMERDSYYTLFSRENSRLAMSLEAPVKKQKINLNLVKTKDETLGLVDLAKSPPGSIERIQVPFEMVKDPRYRVYIWVKDESIYGRLESYLRNHQSVYTPYLGISELIGDFEFIGRCKTSAAEGEAEVMSVVMKDSAKIRVEPKKRYVRERVPGFFDENRVPLEYIDLVYESRGGTIMVEDTAYWKVGDRNVIFF